MSYDDNTALPSRSELMRYTREIGYGQLPPPEALARLEADCRRIIELDRTQTGRWKRRAKEFMQAVEAHRGDRGPAAGHPAEDLPLPTESDMILNVRALRSGWRIGRRKVGKIFGEAKRVLEHPDAPPALRHRANEAIGLIEARRRMSHGSPSQEVQP